MLNEPHPGDAVDPFATDPRLEIRTLGRLALRRDDLNDLFTLGDLCALQALGEDGRLRVDYVDKTRLAYRRAGEKATSADERAAAEQAAHDFAAWVVAAAR
ncbi:MAG: hypothetical protein DWB42_11820, partial [Chloroflexi bacterium]|nr:hypothetical protein [Chloroflexota bacterium]